jgi:hypothetical protein
MEFELEINKKVSRITPFDGTFLNKKFKKHVQNLIFQILPSKQTF